MALIDWFRWVLFLVALQLYLISPGTLAQNNEIVINELKIQPMSVLGSGRCSSQNIEDQQWPSIEVGQIPRGQHVCLRAKVRIDESKLPESPVLLVSMLAAYNIYWDGEPLLRHGQAASNKNDEIPASFKSITPIPKFKLTQGEHILSIEVSSFRVQNAFKSIAYLLMITDYSAVNQVSLFSALFSGVFIGFFVILGLLFQLLFFIYDKNKSFQIFSGICLVAASLITAEQWKFWFNYNYDWHLFRLQLILLLTFSLSCLLPMFYIQNYNLKHRLKWFVSIATLNIVISILPLSYDSKSEWLFISALCSSMVITVLAVRCGNARSKSSIIVLALGCVLLITLPLYFLELGFGLVFTFIVIAIWISLLLDMKRQKEQSLHVARVKSELLKRNLQPHYLMNCLTQVVELIESSPKSAANFVETLAVEFRQLVRACDQTAIFLEDELLLCKNHLKIMSLRYQRQYELTSTGGYAQTRVPSAIIHSQIENCFTHNRISDSRNFMLIVEQIDSSLHLTLKTPIEKTQNHEGLGVGESYIKTKLQETCKEGWALKSYASEGYWVTHYRFELRT